MTEPTRYSRLIDGICDMGGVSADESMQAQCDVSVGGVPFALLPALDGSGDADGVCYVADLGPLPSHGREAFALELLETNLFMFGRNSPSFCVNPESGHILVAGVIPMERLTPGTALQTLSLLAESMVEWRTAFLAQTDKRPEGTAGRLASLTSAGG